MPGIMLAAGGRRSGVANTLLNGLVVGYDPVAQGSGSSLTDYSGNSRTGTLANSPTFGTGGLELVRASEQRVALTSYPVSDDMAMFMRAKHTITNGIQWFIGLWDGDSNDFSLWFENGWGRVVGSWNAPSDPASSPTIDTFYNYLITGERTSSTRMTARLYVDGSLAVTKTDSHFDYTSPPTGLALGHQRASGGSTNSFLDGVIATFASWNRLLESAEIAALHADPLAWKP